MIPSFAWSVPHGPAGMPSCRTGLIVSQERNGGYMFWNHFLRIHIFFQTFRFMGRRAALFSCRMMRRCALPAVLPAKKAPETFEASGDFLVFFMLSFMGVPVSRTGRDGKRGRRTGVTARERRNAGSEPVHPFHQTQPQRSGYQNRDHPLCP